VPSPDDPDTLNTRHGIARATAARGDHAAAEAEDRDVLAARLLSAGLRADRKITWSRRCRVTCHPEILASWIIQHYVPGTATVWRIGFGAMQLPGRGVFGPPRGAIQIRRYRDDVICRARPPGSAG
jgi:hypothetical protein